MAHLHPGEFPPPTVAVYGPGGGPVQEAQLPPTGGGFSLTAHVELADGGSEGVLAAIGDAQGGWAFYLLEGRPVATFALLDATSRVAAETPVEPGAHVLGLHYHPARGSAGASAELTVDGERVAQAPVAGMMFLPNLSSSAAGLLVGRDRGLPVSRDYRPPFPFTGRLVRLEMRSGRPPVPEEEAARVRAGVASD
jgi:arylsulfatase